MQYFRYLRKCESISNRLKTFRRTFVRNNINRPISPKEIEINLQEKIPTNQRPEIRPIVVYTAITPEDNPSFPGLRFDWTQFGLSDESFLDIQGDLAITSPEQANLVVKNIKDSIVQNLQLTSSNIIHLFYAGPAHLALFLGHRLDATAPVTCYGWSDGKYFRTCQLFSQGKRKDSNITHR